MSEISTTLSNADYHASVGHLSSSQIKLILDSPEKYYKRYISKEVKNASSDAMDVGTAIHMRILEPEEYAKQVIVYTGRRAGSIWEAFKETHKDKLILGSMQQIQLDTMYNSFLKSIKGPELISGGQAEVSLFSNLHEHDIRVRADYINVEKGIIFDLKSTSGIIEDEKFKRSAESKQYGYDLQAALYVDAFSKHYSKPFTFYWIVMSKDYDQIKFYKASSKMIDQGRTKYKKGLDLLIKYHITDWKFENEVIELMPSNIFSGGDYEDL